MGEKEPLQVILAGFNVDREILERLAVPVGEEETSFEQETLTPETLSAAYARISRNPAPVPELRREAREGVVRARKSNQRIIFGFGHASVAEHAVFNLDVLGISRLAVEAVQHHRLASFTEKSQRYVRLDGDFVLPGEIAECSLAADFRSLIELQNQTYRELYPVLVDYFTRRGEAEGAGDPAAAAKGHAAEDARYVVSLATQTQFGMTLNSRTAEIMTRACSAYPLAEVRSFAEKLNHAVGKVAPSLVRYTSAGAYEQSLADSASWWSDSAVESGGEPEAAVRLVEVDDHSVERVAAAMLVHRKGVGYSEALRRVGEMARSEVRATVTGLLRHCKPWDPAPREFELAGFTFEIILSSTAYAQLKRHRMSTQINGPYDPGLGWTLPESIKEAGEAERFETVMDRSAQLARTIAERYPAAAAYALTNAHRRRVLIRVNARELQHISRLREDIHAQWDIRAIAREMVRLAREAAPELLLFAAGKHEFEKRKAELFGEKE